MSPTEGRRAAAPPDPSHFRHSYSKDKAQLVRRLSRMEGQVRGIARMIEREEYCVDILQQTAALRAAVDSLSIMVLEDHVSGCVRTAAEQGKADEYVDEVIDVVRRTLGRPVRGPAGPPDDPRRPPPVIHEIAAAGAISWTTPLTRARRRTSTVRHPHWGRREGNAVREGPGETRP